MLRNIEITLTISLNDVVKITSPLITNTGVLCYVSFSHIHIISLILNLAIYLLTNDV